jgi:hypothetical protein
MAMADITITAANVVPGAGASMVDMTAGAALTAGQVVYKEAATGRAKLADADSATLEARLAYGIALNGAANGQPVKVLRGGPVTIGATLVAGTDYWLSGNPGGICPRGDVAAGDRVVLIGIAGTTAILNVAIQDSGVVL